MRRVRSNLNGTGLPIVAAAGINLFMILCVCVLLQNHRLPRFGYNVKPYESHFVIDSYDRSVSHIITVTPGKTPRFFLEENEIPGGMEGIEECLRSWKNPEIDSSLVTVNLVCDEAVSAGTLQQLTDMILRYGYTCVFSGRPPIN